MSFVDRTVGSLREFGLRRTVQSGLSVIEDRVFELRYGIDTLGTVNKEYLNPSSRNATEANYYAPTRNRAFRRLLQDFPFPRDSTFVDLGAGKGKVLLLAAHFGFQRVVGVEFSPELCRIAQQNVVEYEKRAAPRSVIRVVCSDAADYSVHDDECIFFLSNPFGASVMQQVVKNIGVSLDRAPRRIWVIYRHPMHKDVIQAGLELEELARSTYGPIESLLYSNRSPDRT